MTKILEFTEIKLIWRTNRGESRLVVGTLRFVSGDYDFVYDGDDLTVAESKGFSGYPGMANLSATYSQAAMSSFGSRLPSRDRPNLEHLLSGWGANPSMDDFHLLGTTFGRLPTDNFEFIPVIHPEPGVEFYTDLAGLKSYSHSEAFRSLAPGENLTLSQNQENAFDCHAVQVLHEGNQVAHIKKVHCESVSQAISAGIKVDCLFERIRANGVIAEVVCRIVMRS